MLSNQPPSPQPAPKPGASIAPQKIALGCGGFLILLFILLLFAMIFGLSAGEATISKFGLDPTSFKNWTVGLLSIFFGLLNLVSLIILLVNFARFLLTPKKEFKKKTRFGFLASLSFGALFLGLTMWGLIYSYISQFQVQPQELPTEILSEPAYTYSLTSPLQIDFSARRITEAFKQNYDLVSYEWDRENDGTIDLTGENVTFYFPHGGKNNGVFDVTLNLRLQPKDGSPTITKKYLKKVSIATQEIYGEITPDFESGEVPLPVKFDARAIRDPHGAALKNYSWDLNSDGQPEYDGPNFIKIHHIFEKIGEHKVSLTVTSTDLTPAGRYEQKTFTKIISVRSPAGIVESEFKIKAEPKVGTAPLTVKLDVLSENLEKFDKFEWSIGDSLAKLRGQKNKFTFKKPGLYPVTLRGTYFNGQAEVDTLDIRVNDTVSAPRAIITTQPPFSERAKVLRGAAPFTVKFSGENSQDLDQNIVSYDWDFDGDHYWDETGSQVENIFWEIGEYQTRLRVRDADLNESFAKLTIQVEEEEAVIKFGANPISGNAPLTVNFDASGSRLPNNRKIISYEWEFTINGIEAEPVVQTFIYKRAQTAYVFGRVGEHHVKLTLHADDGTKYSAERKIIATHSALTARFKVSRTSGPAPLAISFDGRESSGEIVHGEWIFNDGQTATGKETIHVFEKPGKYEVKLTVYGITGNTASTTKIIEVFEENFPSNH